jgi:peroxiredoxin
MIDRRNMVTQLAALPVAGLLTTGMAAPKRPTVGEIAPDFSLKLLDDNVVTLSELRGRVVMLNFWATWCVPCRKELPLLNTYHALRKDVGLSIYAITTEGSIPLYRLKKFLEKLDMPSARSMKGPYGPIDGAVPTNFVIGRDGVLRYAKAAAFDLDDLNQLLPPLLNQRV